MDLGRISSIANAAEQTDGIAPFDEATWLALRHRPETVRTWVDEDAVALLVGGDLALVVHPASRGRGRGTALLEQALPDGVVTAWSHGDHPAAARLAATHGFDRVRDLWVMRRAAAPLPDLVVPDGITLRSYLPGDADELVRVNAAAFAHHPEQGAMDATQLAERMTEPWFDPAGLLLALDGGTLLAFHWTKQHSPALGEVYVVGVDPAAQGRGLGRLVTLAGLHHLQELLGVTEVLLYVESDNAPAIATYAGLGFAHAAHDTHVQYRRS